MRCGRYYLNPVSWVLYGSVTSQLGDVTSPFTDVRCLFNVERDTAILYVRPSHQLSSPLCNSGRISTHVLTPDVLERILTWVRMHLPDAAERS